MYSGLMALPRSPLRHQNPLDESALADREAGDLVDAGALPPG